MNVIDAIKTRKSVRAYLDKPVEDAKLSAILEAARLAPSASNRQEWRFVIVRDPATRRKIAEIAGSQEFIAEAPVVIVACAETDGRIMKCGQACYPIDVAIALDHITLACGRARPGHLLGRPLRRRRHQAAPRHPRGHPHHRADAAGLPRRSDAHREEPLPDEHDR